METRSHTRNGPEGELSVLSIWSCLLGCTTTSEPMVHTGIRERSR